MTNPIEAAVAPLKADAILRAEKEAKAAIENVRANLEKCGWDMQIAAPFPFSRDTRWRSDAEIKSARSQHDFFSSLTEMRDGFSYSGRIGAPCLVQMSEDRCNRFIEVSKFEAAAQYDAFVAKLVRKIGVCDSAELDGNHVWGWSILTVRKGAEIERWKTQQIVNVSKLGKLFNQWPSRKIK